MLTSLVILSCQSIPSSLRLGAARVPCLGVVPLPTTNHYPLSTTHCLFLPLSPVFATHPKIASVTPSLATLPKTQVFKVLCLPHIQKMAGVGILLLTRTHPTKDRLEMLTGAGRGKEKADSRSTSLKAGSRIRSVPQNRLGRKSRGHTHSFLSESTSTGTLKLSQPIKEED
jgi:hypothetical protein